MRSASYVPPCFRSVFSRRLDLTQYPFQLVDLKYELHDVRDTLYVACLITLGLPFRKHDSIKTIVMPRCVVWHRARRFESAAQAIRGHRHRLPGEHNVSWDTATTNFAQCACDLRVVASPICTQQNVMPPNELLLHALVLEDGFLIDLAGKAPCRGEVNEDRLALTLGRRERCIGKGPPLQLVRMTA